jgi:broad specificity phosphatase PhoE
MARTWDDIRASCGPLQRPLELHLFRHGETDLNARDLFSGGDAAQLTERGKEQARIVGTQLDASYDIAFCSALRRSCETLSLALESRGIDVPIKPDARLNERGLGTLDGQPYFRVEAWDRGDVDWSPQEGESYRQVALRTLDFLLDLREGSKVLICSHAGSVRMLVGALENRDDPVELLRWSVPNATLMRYRLLSIAIPPFLR